MNDNEIFKDVQEEFDITPDDIRGLIGELSSSAALKISLDGGQRIFEDAGWIWDNSMEKAVTVMFGMAINPRWAKDTAILCSAYAQYLNTLYLKAKKEFIEISDAKYPDTIPHGQKDRINAKHAKETAAAATLMYYLRNTYWNLKCTNDTARSVMSMERAEAKLGM